AGGANSRPAPDFPYDSRLLGLPPQCCYLDEPTSEVTNDVCIRWNSPLTWIAIYLNIARSAVHHPEWPLRIATCPCLLWLAGFPPPANRPSRPPWRNERQPPTFESIALRRRSLRGPRCLTLSVQSGTRSRTHSHVNSLSSGRT